MSNHSARYLLIQEERRSRVIAKTNSAGLLTKVGDSNADTVAERIKTLLDVEIIEDGIIDSVMPLTEIILVSVRSLKDSTDDVHSGILFNTFGLPVEEVALMSILIPLTNISPDINTIDPNSLINKPVKVYMSDGVAIEAELVSHVTGGEYHNSTISKRDIKTASLLNLPVEDYLRWIGHDEESIADYLKLKAEDFSKGVVFRFKDEAYWDKDVAKGKDNDVYIEKPWELLIGRNLQKMKTQLCHVPIIMFSGK